VSTIIITVNPKEYDRVAARMVQGTRQSLGVTVAQLAKASGIARLSVAAIERGRTMTHAERHDIAVALGWLSDHHVATG